MSVSENFVSLKSLIFLLPDYSGHRTENAHGSDLFNNHTLLSGKSVTILDFELNSTCLRYNSYSIPPPPLCSTDTKSTSPNSYQYCHTESYQAVKVTWAKLRTAAPQIFQLASKMYMSHDELGELVHSVCYYTIIYIYIYIPNSFLLVDVYIFVFTVSGVYGLLMLIISQC